MFSATTEWSTIMASASQILPEWLEALSAAITNVTEVRDGLAAGMLPTAEDRLDAARAVAESFEVLQPTGKN